MAKRKRRHSDFEVEVYSIGRPTSYETSAKKLTELYKKYLSAAATIENRLRNLGYSEEYIAKNITSQTANKKKFIESYQRIKAINKKNGYKMNTLKETIFSSFQNFTPKQYSDFRKKNANIRKELKESGFDTPEEREKAGYRSISSFEFRYGTKGIDYLSEEYYRIKEEEKLSGKEAGRRISQQYFGSK